MEFILLRIAVLVRGLCRFMPSPIFVAKRQFAATLRTLPPSVRGDFKVDCIACYDDFTLEFASDRRQDSVCSGADDDISKIVAMDAPFYQRGNIDRAPVSVSGGDDHE